MPDKPPSLRERQAQLTQAEILKAARRLFAERGYTRTSVRDIAEAAGVSAQTVYDSIGSKQVLVLRLNDLIDSEGGVLAIVDAAVRSDDPTEVASMSARITRSIVEHCGDILRALVTGASAEPDLQVVLDEGRKRHRGGARAVVERLRAMNALDESVDVDDASEKLAAITDFQFALMLRDSYGWSLDRIETMLAETSRAILLTPPGDFPPAG
jgi:AcrR family transcriptional regulator